MSQTPSIVVEIDEQGETTIEVLNGDGKTCTDLTHALEASIGAVADRKFKPEHRQAQVSARTTQRLRQR